MSFSGIITTWGNLYNVNPLELYKRLPKKNCGKCRMKTCMPFSLAAIRGEVQLSECPLLSEEEISDIKRSLTVFDWREELVLKLRREIRAIDFDSVADGIGAEIKDGSLLLKCLGRDFCIAPGGEIVTHGRMTPWVNILLLHYIRTAGDKQLTGKWVSFSSLKGGIVKASSFQRDCEEPLTVLFEKDVANTASIIVGMGAEKRGGFPTDNAWHLSLLPKLPVTILYWPGEEEFPAKVKILFDSTADSFLDVESLIFLVEGLVRNIEMHH